MIILVTLELKINLPPSFTSTFFSYYFRIRLLNHNKESVDTRDAPITSRDLIINFDLDDEDKVKLPHYTLEIELYQYRLRIFDYLTQNAEFNLKRLKAKAKAKFTETWDEER